MKFKERIKYFIEGVGSILDIYPLQTDLGNYFKYYNAKTGLEKDAQAIAEDWGIVGKDLENSVKKTEEQIVNGN